MKYSKRTITAILAAVLALSLLLTACGTGGDTPTGDNTTPGTSSTPSGDDTTPGTSSTPAGAEGEISTELNESIKYEFEIKKSVADISKYYSSDKKEFNIVKCAEEMGFDISPTQYHGTLGDTTTSGADLRATFPFYYYYAENDFCGVYYYSEDSAFNFIVGSFSFSCIITESEKQVLITGRPEDEKQISGYKDVYANEEIIETWVGLLEYIKSDKFDSGIELIREQQPYTVKPFFQITEYYKSNSDFDITKCASDLGYEIDNNCLFFSLPDGGRYAVRLFSYDYVANKKTVMIEVCNYSKEYAESERIYNSKTIFSCGITLNDSERDNRDYKFIGLDAKEDYSVDKNYVLLSVAEINHYIAVLEKIASAKTLDEVREIRINT